MVETAASHIGTVSHTSPNANLGGIRDSLLRHMESLKSLLDKASNPHYGAQEKEIYDTAVDRKTEAEYQAKQIAVLNELYRVTKPGGSLFYNHKIRWLRGRLIHRYEWVSKTHWVLRQEIIWHRKIVANLRGWHFWQVDERIYCLYKPRYEGDVIGEELKSRHALLTSVCTKGDRTSFCTENF